MGILVALLFTDCVCSCILSRCNIHASLPLDAVSIVANCENSQISGLNQTIHEETEKFSELMLQGMILKYITGRVKLI